MATGKILNGKLFNDGHMVKDKNKFSFIHRSSCGHYTSYANNNGQWLHFNDQTVKQVQTSAVADCKPYILFYIRRDLNNSLWD